MSTFLPAPLSVPAPAKVNLFLAVTGRRPDGFHNLVSLVAPVDWGDTVTVRPVPPGAGDSLVTNAGDLPLGPENLVWKAAHAFRERAHLPFALQIALTKRTPSGAGLGGGSSDAASVLLALQQWHPLPAPELAAVAAQVGSDVPLFLARAPVLMSGRGEIVEALPPTASARLAGTRLLLFKPGWGIPTPWAYQQLAQRQAYQDDGWARTRVAAWLAGQLPLAELLFNAFEVVALGKYIALAAALDTLRQRWRLPVLLSGSGSACFAVLPPGFADLPAVTAYLDEAWGPAAWHQMVSLGAPPVP